MGVEFQEQGPDHQVASGSVGGVGRRRFGLAALLVGGVTASVAACNGGDLSVEGKGKTADSLNQRSATLSGSCGDNQSEWPWEQCDTGGGGSRACSTTCQALSFAVSDVSTSAEYLGGSAHPLLALSDARILALQENGIAEASRPVTVVGLDHEGEPLFRTPLGAGVRPAWSAHAGLAPLGGGGAWALVLTAFDADSDGLGIALYRGESDGSLAFMGAANEAEEFMQHGGDVVWTGTELVVAWETEGSDGRLLAYRRFDENLDPISGEEALTGPDTQDGALSLAEYQGTFAVAWRRATSPGLEQVLVTVPALGLSWTTSEHSSAANGLPVLAAVGDNQLLVAFGAQAQDGTEVLSAALLSPETPGLVEECPLGHSDGTWARGGVAQRGATLAQFGEELRLAWTSAAPTAHPGAEEVWMQAGAVPSGAISCTELEWGQPEFVQGPFVADDQAAEDSFTGDQRHVHLGYGDGWLFSAWENYELDPGEFSPPRVEARMVRVGNSCTEEQPCNTGEGHCVVDTHCLGALRCGYKNGAAYGYPDTVNVCTPCGNGVVDLGEECDMGLQTDGCNANCTLSYCGDGILNSSGEQCDPGVETAECTSLCTVSSCGDGYVNPAALESCEPLQPGSGDPACDADCSVVACGDGLLNPAAGEECELDNAECQPDCTLPVSCGPEGCPVLQSRVMGSPLDGELRGVMSIEWPGAAGATDLSPYTVRYWFTQEGAGQLVSDVYWNQSLVEESGIAFGIVATPAIGADSFVEVPLEGQLPAGGQVTIDYRFAYADGLSSLDESDDYSYLDTTSLTVNPSITAYKAGVLVWGQEPGPALGCGNGVQDPGEECDDGVASANCDADCTIAVCGDGVVNTASQEACEPSLDPACSGSCQYEACTDPFSCLHVKFRSEAWDSDTDGQLRFDLSVVNNSPVSVALSSVALEYWLTKEPPGAFVPSCQGTDWNGGCLGVDLSAHGEYGQATGADYVWNISFSSGPTLEPGDELGWMALHAVASPWAAFSEADDYSRPSGDAEQVADHVGLVVNGVRIWGEAP